jgi:response regulator RpfG family c-di-GMP phosphodiesterase
LNSVNPKESIPVFILTSSINPSDMEKAKSYKEVHDFLSKPLTEEKLNEIVKAI